MLTKVDEFPVHQTTDTFAAVLSGDKHWNDGHYICLCDASGNVQLVSTVRLYQNNDVLDGFVCIRHGSRQHNFRVSRRLRPQIDHYGAGPLRIELVEPMKAIAWCSRTMPSGSPAMSFVTRLASRFTDH